MYYYLCGASNSYKFLFFFFNDTATTEIYTLSLHDALPIYRHERLCDLGREAGHDDGSAEQPGRFDRLHEVVRDVRVHGRDAGDVDDHDLRAVGADRPQQLLGELARPLRIDHADDGENEQALAHLQHRRRQLPDRLLLLPDDALALLHEAHGHRVGDAVGRGLVGVEDAVELVEVFV